ncbi:MAG: hypothetical protein ACYSWQ_12830 [Planctomycetota bacterium]|jgi:hypothetical protein
MVKKKVELSEIVAPTGQFENLAKYLVKSARMVKKKVELSEIVAPTGQFENLAK